jgi:nitrate reductase delta subunit
MISTVSDLELIAELFEYPAADFRARLSAAAAAIASPNAAGLIAAFASSTAERSLAQMEELYIQTFDMNPDTCLDIGWHLFGEDYARGEFLVKVRQQMRRYGIAEREELPDSLLVVLPLAARMPEEEAVRFRTGFLRPAVEKIRKGVPAESNPYANLLSALAALLPVEETFDVAKDGGLNHFPIFSQLPSEGREHE